jgi:hypothetical protein
MKDALIVLFVSVVVLGIVLPIVFLFISGPLFWLNCVAWRTVLGYEGNGSYCHRHTPSL